MSSSSRRNSNIYTDIAGTGVTVIETVKGDYFLIDTDVKSAAEKHTWSRLPFGEHGYARAGINRRGEKQKTVLLHRLVSGIESAVDHINGLTFDCRLSNLRPANKSQNACNQKRRADNKTGVKGVTFVDGMFRGRVHISGKTHNVGRFKTIEEAEKAMIMKRHDLHGEFARHE